MFGSGTVAVYFGSPMDTDGSKFGLARAGAELTETEKQMCF